MSGSTRSRFLGVLFVLALAAVGVAGLAGTAQAAVLYWDTNGVTTVPPFGDSVASTGTWGTDNWWTMFSSGAFGDGGRISTTSLDNLIINASGASAGSPNTQINVSGNQYASSIYDSAGNNSKDQATLSGGTIHLYSTVSGATTSAICGTGDYQLAISSALVLEQATGSNVYIGGTESGGNGAVTITGGITSTNSGLNLILQTNHGMTISGADLNFQGSLTSTKTNSFTISANIGSNVTSVTQNGVAGTMNLAGTNSYTGATTVSAGTLAFGSTAAIGGAGASVTVNPNGAVVLTGAADPSSMFSRIATTSAGTIALDTASSAAIDFNTAGFTAASLGAAVNNVTYTGTLTPNGTTYRLGGGGKVLTLTNNTITGAGNSLVITGAAAGSGVVLSGANDYDGATTVNSGTLTVNGASGAIASSASTSIRGGTLALDYTAGNTDRINNAVTLGGGTLSLTGNATTDTTETIGTLGIDRGSSIISVGSAASRVTTLAASAFSRANNATALVRGTSLNQTAATNVSRITLADSGASLSLVGTNTLAGGATNDATQALKIVPYLFGDIDTSGTGTNFVTYDTTLGLRTLTAAEQTILAAGSTTAANPVNAIAFNGSITAATGITVNSLLFTGAQALNSSGASTPVLTVNSGAIALVANNAASIGAGFTGGLTLGNGEGVITVKQNTLTINAPISVTSSGGLTKAGAGTLTLSSTTSNYTGKTIVQAGTLNLGTNVYLTNAGVAGPLGMPTGDNATIDMYNGTTLFTGNTSPRVNQATDRTINLAGAGVGTVNLNVNDNDTSFTFGAVTATGTGAKTFNVYLGAGGNGDRESMIFNGSISDASDAPLSLQATFRTQSGSESYLSLNAGGTFTGPITLIKGANVSTSYFTVGGVRTKDGGIPGSGTLAGGNYAGNISLDTTTIFNYYSSANQSLSGVISGPGSLMNSASGTLTLTNANTFSGTTTVSGGRVVMGNALALQNSPYNTTGSTGAIGLDVTGYTTPLLGGLAGNVDVATAITGSGYSSVTALTLNPQAGVSVTYSGAIGDGTPGMTITKTGPGTQILSGTNAYTGGTNVNYGTLTYLNTNAKPITGITTVAADATLGLGVSGASAFTATDVKDLFAGTLTNVTNSATSYVGIDTTNGNFTFAESVPATTRGLVKLGSNTLTLSGNSTYNGLTLMTGGTLTLDGTNAGSGGVMLSAGTLNINNAGALGTGVLTIGANTTIGNTGVPLNVNSNNTPQVWNGNFTTSGIVNLGTGAVSLNANTTTMIGANSTLIVGGAISGSFNLTKQYAGVLELTGANIYTGTTGWNNSGGAGWIRVSGTGTLGTGAVTVPTISILDITSSATQNVGKVTVSGGWILGGTINSTTVAADAYNGHGYITSNLQGTGAGLTANNALGLFLSGTNTYGGATTVGGGMLVPIKPASLPNSGASGTITENNAASLLVLRTGTGQWDATAIGNLMSNAAFTLTAAGAAVGIDTAAGDFTYGSALPATTNLALTKMGPNNLTLTAANLYPAKTTINRGTLTLNGATGSLAATSALTFSGTSTFNYDNVDAIAATSQSLGALTFSAGDGTVQTTRTVDTQTIGLTFASLAVRTAGATGNFVLGGTPGTNGTDSKISFTTAPTASAFIDKGVFFGGSAYAAYDSGGFLRAMNYSTDNSGTGGVSVASSFATFTAAGANGKHVDLDTAGSISAAGTESINSLRIGANGTNAVTLAGGSTLTIANGGILKTGGNATTISGGTGISGSAELVIRTDTAGDVLSIGTPILGNTVTKTGAGTLELSGANTFTALRLNQGQLNVNSSTALGGAGVTLTINEGTTLDNTSGSNVNLNNNLNVNINGSFTYIGTGGNDLNLNSSNSGSFNFINDATVTVQAGTLSIKNVAAASNAAITKNGAGTLVWGGNGTLNLRGPLIVNNGVVSCMTENQQDYQSIGTGLVFLGDTTPSNSNPATINFVNSNSDMNPITVRAGSSGIIAITNDNGNHNFSGPLALNNNLTLSHIVNGGTLSYYGAISGTGGLNIGNTGSITISSVAKSLANVGTVALYGVNTHSGDTVVNSGTLALGNLNVLQNSTLDTGTSGSQQVTFAVAGNRTYNIGGLKGSDDLAIGGNTISVGANGAGTGYSGVISGTNGALKKVGAGTLTLNGINTYTGDTTVEAGTLSLADNAGLNFIITGTGLTTNSNKITGTGTVSLAGDFTFDLTSAGTALNDQWMIVNNATLAETFTSNFTVGGFTPVSGGILWTKAIDSTNIYEFSEFTGKLTVKLALVPGDTNDDKVVDAADYIAIKTNFGLSGAGITRLQGDLVDDDVVDWADLQELMANFATRSVGEAPAVPEPGSVMLLMFGAAALLRRRKA